MIGTSTTASDIKRFYNRVVQIIEDCVVEEFTEWAKQDDEYLRNNDGFIDHTGNLRSSLGAAVVKKAVIEYITPFATILNGTKGSAAGRALAERVATRCKNRIAKVMVAGMDYAQHVEDIDSKDVLESRRIQCEREAREVTERAMRKAEKKIKAL